MTKSTTALSSTRRIALEAFMSKVLEPVTDAELIDTQYNSLVRNTRSQAWTAAKYKAAYFEALMDASTCLSICSGRANSPVEFVASLPSRKDLVDLYRQALAEQLLTPAFEKKDIEWKKRQLKKLSKCVPVRPEDVTASIQADEDFLARHPVKRERGG